jgi:hypothetical protein
MFGVDMLVMTMRSSDMSHVTWNIPADLTILGAFATGACLLARTPTVSYPGPKSGTDDRNIILLCPGAGFYSFVIDIQVASLPYAWAVYAAAVQTDLSVYYNLNPLAQ